jgi:hypothetical protein
MLPTCALHRAAVEFVVSGSNPRESFDRMGSCNVGAQCKVCASAILYGQAKRAREEAGGRFPDPDLRNTEAALHAAVRLYRENGWECQAPSRET